MAEFEDLQNLLQAARDALRGQSRSVAVNAEQGKALEQKERAVLRRFNADSNTARAVAAERAGLEQKATAERAARDRGRIQLDAAFDRFLPFTDPRENLTRLPDSAPFLLLPVRLETKFKIVARPGGQQHQLWVRIFPDDCAIDTFDDLLSQSEVTRARNYWAAVWAAGTPANASLAAFVREKRIAAWRKLMGSFNGGRAHWITTRHQPLNAAQMPVRNQPSDRLAIIVTAEPPPPAQQTALVNYWQAVIAAAASPAAVAVAFTALTGATGLGQDQAAQLLTRYAPNEIAEIIKAGEPEGDVRVTFVVFDTPADIKQSAWSHSAKVRTFPERFVLLGYAGNDAPPIVNLVGAPIPNPLIVGPDSQDDVETLLLEINGPGFETLSDEEKAAKYVEYLSQQAETRWLFDFDRAVQLGLGFRVDLTAAQYERGFTRLFVLGVQLATNASKGKSAIESLLHNHQFGDAGFSLLPQGTPTNNTEEAGSGYSIRENPEEAYDRYLGVTPIVDAVDGEAVDGHLLARALGIDPELAKLRTAQHYASSDQAEARAMQTALWNATLGYFLESMLPGLADEGARRRVRQHFLQHVRGRGSLPCVRIGKQPYGIVTLSNLRNFKWAGQGRDLSTIGALFRAAMLARAELHDTLAQVAHVGAGGNAHTTLLHVLGLHPSSVEYDRRIAESFASLRNTSFLIGHSAQQVEQVRNAYRESGIRLLQRLGYPGATNPPDVATLFPIFERTFFGEQEDVTKPPVDAGPLSELRALLPCTADNKNYIQWLIDKAQTDHAAIRDRSGFLPGKTPSAILFDLLTHSMHLGFGESALGALAQVGRLEVQDMRALRLDKEFIGIAQKPVALESKWDLIYRKEPLLSQDKTIAAYISTLLVADVADDAVVELRAVTRALGRLANLPTARLERCLAEHIDLCHYRLDAWLLSFVDAQLAGMRLNDERAGNDNGDSVGGDSVGGDRAGGDNGEGANPAIGTYIGAYGWVEDLKPQARELSPVELDAEQQAALDPNALGGIVRDSSNAGYVHAPSIPHGLTAAVLRNAYISSASEAEPDRYKVNLSSERVRMALAMIEGIQQGQGLAELLGYQLERGLHDNGGLELDAFIYDLRKVFPLVSNRMQKTKISKSRAPNTSAEATRFAEEEEEFEDERAVSKVEARNVVDGLALLERAAKPGNGSYPFGFPIGTGAGMLRQATPDERAAIDAQVAQLSNVRDAVADVAIAESVHQTVQGNYERAAGALDAFSKGAFPQLPDVIASPSSGRGLTHRFGVHFPAGISPDVGQTPRSKAEPALNAWLASLFPPAATIQCSVRFRPRPDPESPPPAWSTFPVTFAALALEPIDLLYLHDANSAKNLSALDDLVLRAFKAAAPRRLDLELEIDYVSATPTTVSFFQLGALLATLRSLVLGSRPLEANDLSLQNEGTKSRNGSARVAPERLQKAHAELTLALGALGANVIAPLGILVDADDPSVGAGNFVPVLAAIDARVEQFGSRLAKLGAFGFEGSGSAFVLDRLRAIRSKLAELVRERAKTWQERSERYQAIIDDELPLATTEAAQIEVWHRAEKEVSTTFTTVFANAAALGLAVSAKRTTFEGKRTQAATLLSQAFTNLAAVFAAGDALLLGAEGLDLKPLELKEAQRMVVVLAEDLLRQAQKLHALGTDKSNQVQALITQAATAPAAGIAELTQAAQTLFGEGFRLYPEFTLGADQVQELQLCLADQAQLLQFQTASGTDDPTEDWLYGLARVREKLGAWESMLMFAEGFVTRPPLTLTPIQLPYRTGDSWLGLAYPPEHVLLGDNLLYTAHAPNFDPTQSVVGALLDEWTETLPSRQETTALTFHFDRPNNEAPQALLLVTPAAMSGQWQWTDLVGALHEALELSRLRALEPDLIDKTEFAKLLPATLATLTVHPVTMAVNFAAQTLATQGTVSLAGVNP